MKKRDRWVTLSFLDDMRPSGRATTTPPRKQAGGDGEETQAREWGVARKWEEPTRWCQGCHTMRPAREFGRWVTCERCRARCRENGRERRAEAATTREHERVDMIGGQRGMPDLQRRGLLCREVERRRGDREGEVVLEVV